MYFPERFRWIRYHSEIDQKPAMISMDHALKEELDGQNFRYLGWVQLKAKPSPEGLMDISETRRRVMELLPQIQEVLANIPCYLAGLTVQKGEVMFLFYCAERIRKTSVFRPFIKHHAQWNIQIGQVVDEAWETYTELLEPSREDRNHWRNFIFPA